jgi:hypothetical protein
MDSNTHSPSGLVGPADQSAAACDDEEDLAALSAVLDRLAARDLDRLTDTVRASRAVRLRPMVDRLEAQWLREVAGVDARGAAGAEDGVQVGSTAGWLRARLRMGRDQAATAIRTARALFRGPLTQTAQALCDGEISVAHANMLAAGTKDLASQVAVEAEPNLVDAARQLDPPRLRQLVEHLQYTLDPEDADAKAQRRHGRRGVWLTPTLDRMVAIGGLLDPEAGHTLRAALEPLARPADHHDTRSGGQRTADALTELARRALEGGQLPKTGGVRPQLSVIIDLDSLTGHPGALGGEVGWAAPLSPAACQRLACDATMTRVLVSRQPGDSSEFAGGLGDPHGSQDCSDSKAWSLERLLRAAMAKLPPILGGARSQVLDVGRSTRVVSPAQRHALAVRDGGCVFPGCSRPVGWCEAHHVWHWLDGGPTDLGNLALVCREHHRAIHDGGWHLARGPDGRFTATPPQRRHRAA